jgi:hypothetical protein
MILNIAGNHEWPGIWERVYYFNLADYPNITNWELRKIILFFDYEKKHGRKTEIVCENIDVIKAVNHALVNPELYLSAKKPDIITSCSANKICRQQGCLTDYLYHGTGIENAKSILKCLSLLSASAVEAKIKTVQESAEEGSYVSDDPLGDPPDYFDYIMMTWGNCIGGDSLVMERMLGRFPNEHEFSRGFKPGVRFYFKYESIENHPDFTNDGHHPAKVKNEIVLSDYLHCCIIPEHNQLEFENIIPPVLTDKVFYIKNDCADIWDWTDKVYNRLLE